MYFFFTKIVQELLWPLNWSLAGLLVAQHFLRTERVRKARVTLIVSFLALFLPSLPATAWLLRRPLESAFPSRPIAEYPGAEAIVVLGGSVAGKVAPRYEAEELNGSRLLPVARLFRLGKAPLIIASSGYVYDAGPEGKRYDAVDMKDILVDMGVPASAILTETESRTTRENAELTGKILRARGIKRILLVTSAFHLRRAVTWFQKEGLEIVAVPTALEVVGKRPSFSSLLPAARALSSSTESLKEYFGWLAAAGG